LLSVTPNADDSFLKHDVLRALLRLHHVSEEREFFSKGSTVTKASLVAIYNSILSEQLAA